MPPRPPAHSSLRHAGRWQSSTRGCRSGSSARTGRQRGSSRSGRDGTPRGGTRAAVSPTTIERRSPRGSSARATSAQARPKRSPSTSAATSRHPVTATIRTASRSTSASARSGKGLGKLKDGSWFHRWLQTHANRLGFQPLATEAWHWTYHPPGGQSEAWASEVTSSSVRPNRVEVPRVPLLSRHRGSPPDLILRWNDMTSVPQEIDVVVHLHGFWYAGMKLPKDIEPVSGLDLTPIEGAVGTRPVASDSHRAAESTRHGSAAEVQAEGRLVQVRLQRDDVPGARDEERAHRPRAPLARPVRGRDGRQRAPGRSPDPDGALRRRQSPPRDPQVPRSPPGARVRRAVLAAGPAGGVGAQAYPAGPGRDPERRAACLLPAEGRGK